MTRSELIVPGRGFPALSASDVELSVRILLDRMAQALAVGGRVEIRGFGSFGINYRPPRRGRNPKTGAAVDVPGKYVPHFKSGKELRERVDRPHAG